MFATTRRSALLAALAAIASVPSGSLARADNAALYEAAKREGEVVWYTSQVQNTLVRPMAAAFEAKYPGIKVTIVGGKNADLVLKLLAEAKAGLHIADVNSPSRIDKLDKVGLLARYEPASAKDFPAELKSRDGKWTAMLGSVFGTAINTDLVKPEDEPRTFDDYLDQKWKGKMAWVAHLDIGGGPGFVEAVFARMGKEAGTAYLKKLARQEIIEVPANQRVVMDQMIAGEYPMALMMFQHHAATSAGKGAPVKWLSAGPVITITATIALMAQAPHPNAGELFIDFVLSEEGQRIIRDAGYPPVRPGVEARRSVMSEAAPETKALAVTPENEEAILEAGIAVYLDLFR